MKEKIKALWEKRSVRIAVPALAVSLLIGVIVLCQLSGDSDKKQGVKDASVQQSEDGSKDNTGAGESSDSAAGAANNEAAGSVKDEVKEKDANAQNSADGSTSKGQNGEDASNSADGGNNAGAGDSSSAETSDSDQSKGTNNTDAGGDTDGDDNDKDDSSDSQSSDGDSDNNLPQKADASYERWLAAAMVTAISMQWPDDFQIDAIYVTSETEINHKEDSNGAYVVFTTGGNQMTLCSRPIENERSTVGTMDLYTLDLGFATFDQKNISQDVLKKYEQVELSSLNTLISQSSLVSIYER